MIPLADVCAILLSAGLTGWCGDPERAGRIRGLAGRLAADLLDRVRLFVRGHSQTAGLAAAEAAALPVFLCGRGLQMIARRVRGGGRDGGNLGEAGPRPQAATNPASAPGSPGDAPR